MRGIFAIGTESGPRDTDDTDENAARERERER